MPRSHSSPDILYFCQTCGAAVEKGQKAHDHPFALEARVANRGYMLQDRGDLRRLRAAKRRTG